MRLTPERIAALASRKGVRPQIVSEILGVVAEYTTATEALRALESIRPILGEMHQPTYNALQTGILEHFQ